METLFIDHSVQNNCNHKNGIKLKFYVTFFVSHWESVTAENEIHIMI